MKNSNLHYCLFSSTSANEPLKLSPECQTISQPKKIVSSPRQKIMHATFTYRPLRHFSTPRLRDADGSLRQAPRRSAGHAATHPVQPLKGLPGTRATDVSYRALAPGGAGDDGARTTVHCSLITDHCSLITVHCSLVLHLLRQRTRLRNRPILLWLKILLLRPEHLAERGPDGSQISFAEPVCVLC